MQACQLHLQLLPGEMHACQPPPHIPSKLMSAQSRNYWSCKRWKLNHGMTLSMLLLLQLTSMKLGAAAPRVVNQPLHPRSDNPQTTCCIQTWRQTPQLWSQPLTLNKTQPLAPISSLLMSDCLQRQIFMAAWVLGQPSGQLWVRPSGQTQHQPLV